MKYSDFEKSIYVGISKCKDCKNCRVSTTGFEFAKCSAMHLVNGYEPFTKDNTGFGNTNPAFISLLIENNKFPNKEGNCPYFQAKIKNKIFNFINKILNYLKEDIKHGLKVI